MVIYYTGTGNSRYIAERIADKLRDELFCIDDSIKNEDTKSIDSDGRIVFVTPTYAWRIPRIVNEWIRKTHFAEKKQAWFVMNCGDSIGNAGKYNERLCRSKGFSYMGTFQIIMPENYVAMFKTPNADEARQIVLMSEPLIDKAADIIYEGKPFSHYGKNPFKQILSGPVNAIFYHFFVKAKAFYASENCIGCKKCGSLCPLNNITFKNGKPVWGERCTHCMACISYCPKGAIEYGKKSAGKEKYSFESLHYVYNKAENE